MAVSRGDGGTVTRGRSLSHFSCRDSALRSAVTSGRANTSGLAVEASAGWSAAFDDDAQRQPPRHHQVVAGCRRREGATSVAGRWVPMVGIAGGGARLDASRHGVASHIGRRSQPDEQEIDAAHHDFCRSGQGESHHHRERGPEQWERMLGLRRGHRARGLCRRDHAGHVCGRLIDGPEHAGGLRRAVARGLFVAARQATQRVGSDFAVMAAGATGDVAPTAPRDGLGLAPALAQFAVRPFDLPSGRTGDVATALRPPGARDAPASVVRFGMSGAQSAADRRSFSLEAAAELGSQRRRGGLGCTLAAQHLAAAAPGRRPPRRCCLSLAR